MSSILSLDDGTRLLVEESVEEIQRRLNRSMWDKESSVLLLHELNGRDLAVWAGRIRYVSST